MNSAWLHSLTEEHFANRRSAKRTVGIRARPKFIVMKDQPAQSPTTEKCSAEPMIFAVDSGSSDRDMERVSIIGGKHLDRTLLELPFDVDDDLNWLEQEIDPAFIASLAKARQQVKDGRTKSRAEVRDELGIITE